MDNIKKAANHVFKTLGAGFSERIYHNAMEVLLKRNNIPFESELVVPVMFEDVKVGEVRADLVIDDKIVVELKSVRSIKEDHCTQCGMYMKLLGINSGVVINFPCNDDEEVEFEELVGSANCSRCGRDNHAKKHIHGSVIGTASSSKAIHL